MSITENKARIGSFTSSEIYKLIKTGTKGKEFSAPGLTYIQEKQIELRLQRSITTDSHSNAMAWGTFMEQYVFSLIGIEYKITSNVTDVHPTIKGWSGSKDLIQEGVKISDIKCYQPKNFALYADALASKDLERIKAEFPKEYWQLVSNAIINEVPKAEAILFMPYESELEEIKAMALAYEGADMWKYRFIYESDKSALPYIPDGGHYSNLNTFEFEVPQSDIDLLTERVELAIKYLKQ